MRFLLAAALLALAANRVEAADIAIALTNDIVEVDAGFSGAKVVLFGALTHADSGAGALDDEANDIIAVVRGPATAFNMRPMQREGVIWTAGAPIRIRAPGVILTSATRPVAEIAPPAVRRALNIGADPESVAALIQPTSLEAAAHVGAAGAVSIGRAFLDAATRAGRVAETADAVVFKKGALFSINIVLPPTTPVGLYEVEVFLFRGGALVSRDNARLSVGKVGLERGIYAFANERPIAYGLGCVAISLIAGWLAAAAFRK